MRPMLATRTTSVPAGDDWLHEVKWDGMRVLVSVTDGTVRVTSRNENDVTVSFPELGGLGERSALGGRDVVLDGEVCGFLDGLPVFGALAERMHVRSARRAQELAARHPVTLLAFDLLSWDGMDLLALPLQERRRTLESLELVGPRWQVPPASDDGTALLAATDAQGLEGVVSKRRTSAYRPGQRSEDWRKLAHRHRRSLVVGGWRPEAGSDGPGARIGAVLVGLPGAEGLVYLGRVGSGLAGKAAARLAGVLEPLGADAPPFAGELPREDVEGTRWVRPEVVVDVESLGLTPQGRLRQPAYVGVRADLAPSDLVGDDDG